MIHQVIEPSAGQRPTTNRWHLLAERILAGHHLSEAEALEILASPDD